MRLIKNKEIERDKWVDLLNNSKFSSPFQTYEFYDFYNSIKGLSADVFAIEKDDEYKSLVVVTVQKEKGVKGFFSIRGIIYGGPILGSSDLENLDSLLLGLNQAYKKGIIYIEMRNSFDYGVFNKIFEDNGWIYEKRLNVKLDIKDKTIDAILSKMKYNRRREIKLSYKEGATKRLANNEDEIIILYEILKELYLTRVKLPLPDKSYFLNLYKSDLGKVFVVIHNDTIIGGSFCFFDRNAIYTSYYVGLRNYHRKIFPTHLAIIGVIEFAIKNNLNLVDFMGAGKPNENYGVRDFKLQFGGDLIENGRFQNILNPFMYKTGTLGLKLISKLK